jgi:hypothetical protein
MNHCPRCDSPQPHLHPAVQAGGEVQPCSHEFHRQDTPSNRPYLPNACNTGLHIQALIDTMSGYVIKASDLRALGPPPCLEQLNQQQDGET